MDLDTCIVAVYCLVDDLMEAQLGSRRLRSRGPAPILDDREVLTIEVVGEFLGRHYGEWFPALRRVYRTTFSRQAANLWAVKRHLSPWSLIW